VKIKKINSTNIFRWVSSTNKDKYLYPGEWKRRFSNNQCLATVERTQGKCPGEEEVF